MPRRTYRQACGIAKALDRVGERWTLLIVRNLLLGPLRYSDLRAGLPGITTNLLAKRLRELRQGGLVVRERAPVPDATWRYRLTARGAALEPVLQALGAWGWPDVATADRRDLRDLTWLLVAVRRWYRGGLRLRVELVVDGIPYRLVLAPKAIEVKRGPLESPDLRVRTTAEITRLLLVGVLPPSAAGSEVTVEGNPRDFHKLVAACSARSSLPTSPAGLALQ